MASCNAISFTGLANLMFHTECRTLNANAVVNTRKKVTWMFAAAGEEAQLHDARA
jgi:hypothetical protein